MKKVILLILCLLLFLAGCSASGKPAPAVTPDIPFHVGMSSEEFWELYDSEDIIPLTGFSLADEAYFLMEDDNGNPVVLTLNSKNSITAIAAYDKSKIKLTSRSFFSIKAGMTVQEVISILGHPLMNYSANGDRLTWKVDDTFFHVQFRSQPSDPSILVVYDVFVSSESYTSIINHWYIPFID